MEAIEKAIRKAMASVIDNLASLLIPDTDFWARKSIQQQITTSIYTKTEFYSVKIDQDRDGYADRQVNYEKIDRVGYNK